MTDAANPDDVCGPRHEDEEMIRVVYDRVSPGADVTDAFENMACVMGEHLRFDPDNRRRDQQGRLRWIALKPPWHRRFWARWLGEYPSEEVGPLIKTWARRLRCDRRNSGFIYVMWYRDFVTMLVSGKSIPGRYRLSLFHVPHIDPAALDDHSLFKITPPVKGWPQRIRL